MKSENDWLVREKPRIEQFLQMLKHSSDEFYLRALLERTAYDNPNWLADTSEYFERSIKAQATEDNVFQYALFLQKQNRLDPAEGWYQKYLDEFAGEHQSKRAMTLNNMGLLHYAKDEWEQAEAEFAKALTIFRQLVPDNRSAFLPDLAMTLNNLANLHRDMKKLGKAKDEFTEALTKYHQLAEGNRSAFLPQVAITLDNLANLHRDEREWVKAEEKYREALGILEEFANDNPSAFLPYVARTLTHWGLLHRAKKKWKKTEQKYHKALTIFRQLAANNPVEHSPGLAVILANLAFHYWKDAPKQEDSIRYAKEVVRILQPIVETVPYTKECLETAKGVLQGWGLSEEDVQKMLAEGGE
jgi:hypothetical protein